MRRGRSSEPVRHFSLQADEAWLRAQASLTAQVVCQVLERIQGSEGVTFAAAAGCGKADGDARFAQAVQSQKIQLACDSSSVGGA